MSCDILLRKVIRLTFSVSAATIISYIRNIPCILFVSDTVHFLLCGCVCMSLSVCMSLCVCAHS